MHRPARAAVTVAAIAVASLFTTEAPAQTYPYCSIPNTQRVLVLIDRTTRFDPKDDQVLIDALTKIHGGLNAGDRLVIRTISDDFARSEFVFDRCRPGCPPQGLLDQLFGRCSDLIARRDNVAFLQELAKSLKTLINEKRDFKASDILRTIHIVVGNFATSPPSRMVLFSDMIENSAFGRFALATETSMHRLLMRLQQQRIIPNLKGSNVEAFGFGRLDSGDRRGLTPLQMATIRNFWDQYFKLAGARRFSLSEQLSGP